MKIFQETVEKLCVGVAAAGLALGTYYSGPGEEFVRGYLNDVTFPFGFYFGNKLLKNFTGGGISPLVDAGIIFAGCSALEIAQKAGLYAGNFDSKDFLAYAAGAGLALAVDKIIKKTGIESVF